MFRKRFSIFHENEISRSTYFKLSAELNNNTVSTLINAQGFFLDSMDLMGALLKTAINSPEAFINLRKQ